MHAASKWEIVHLYVKLFLCLNTMVWRHKLCGCKSLHIFGHSIAWSWIVSPTPLLPCPMKCYHFTSDRKLNGCRVSLDTVMMRKHSAVLGIELYSLRLQPATLLCFLVYLLMMYPLHGLCCIKWRDDDEW